MSDLRHPGRGVGLDHLTDCAVIGLWDHLQPVAALPSALSRRRSARDASRLAKASMSDSVLVAGLTAFITRHSFSTFSQKLRYLTCDYPCRVRSFIEPAESPFPARAKVPSLGWPAPCRGR